MIFSLGSEAMKMRTAGMIGGLGPESTVDYYRLIISRYRGRTAESGYPQLIVNSLDVDRGIALLNAGRLDELTHYLETAVNSLARAGAEFGFMAANTPHLVFDELQRRSPIPLLSIVRATAAHAKANGLRNLGLFGTGFTMRANFYPVEFERSGLVLVTPRPEEIDFIHRKYIDELLNNRFLPETATEILNIAQRLRDEKGVEAIVLAGTELPLLLRDFVGDFCLLDTTRIHVEAIVDELLR
jgi:aspartate racemase